MIDVQKNVILSPYTTFKIGGPAEFFVEVGSGEELVEAIEFANEKSLDFFILGGGSNVLVSDKGFSGLVIKINSKLFVAHDVSIGCGAGWSLAKIVKEAAACELSGLEWAIGIPGTVGGAIRGNAGTPGGKISDSIKTVNYVNTEDLVEELGGKKTVKIKTLKKEECEFSYRESIFKQNKNLIILSASFELRRGNGDKINEKMKELIRDRVSRQPHGASAGSFFKNPVIENKKIIDEFESETGLKVEENKNLYQDGKIKIPAAWFIDMLGLKGKKMGGAMVSEEHANFIVNTGTATAENVIMLGSFIKQQVRDQFGVELLEEIQYVGF